MLKLRKSKGSKDAYSKSFLLDSLKQAAKTTTDEQFAQFQKEALVKFDIQMKVDAISIIQCDLDGNGMIADTGTTVFFNMRGDELAAYRRVQHLDVTRSAVLRNIGTAVFNTDFRSLEDWRKTPFFNEYYRPLNLLHSVSLAYGIPFHNSGRLQITYFKSMNDEFSPKITKDTFELFTLPFYYAWAYRIGIIDEKTFTEWLNLLARRTPMQLFLLRSMMGMSRYSIAALASKFDTTTRMVNHHFAEIYDDILPQISVGPALDGNASKMIDLCNAYQFLRYVGDYRPRTN